MPRRRKKPAVEAPQGPPVVVWFRQDLRLDDNPALADAAASGRPVHALFITECPDETNGWGVTGAAKLWLHHALASLAKDLWSELGCELQLLDGSQGSIQALARFLQKTGATTLYFNRVYEPWLTARDLQLSIDLPDLELRSFNGHLLYEPDDARPETRPECLQMGFGSVGFFMRACEQLPTPRAPVARPTSLRAAAAVTEPADRSLQLAGLDRMPRRKDGSVIDWGAPIREAWDMTEAGARAALDRFIEEGAARRFGSRTVCGCDGLS